MKKSCSLNMLLKNWTHLYPVEAIMDTASKARELISRSEKQIASHGEITSTNSNHNSTVKWLELPVPASDYLKPLTQIWHCCSLTSFNSRNRFNSWLLYMQAIKTEKSSHCASSETRPRAFLVCSWEVGASGHGEGSMCVHCDSRLANAY